MRSFRGFFVSAAFLLVFSLTGVAIACDECVLEGNIEAEWNSEQPDLGLWKYTMTLTWDTGYYSIDYIMLFLDELDQNCTCEEIEALISFPVPAGNSEAGPDYPDHWHTCDWEGSVECVDNPCLPDRGIYMRFDPYNCGGNPPDHGHPGCCGGGIFFFYSDYPPTDVSVPNMFFKLGEFFDACEGQLTGVFPALPCDPTPSEVDSWGGIKTLYR
jgi:hypothetical protein